MFNSSAPEWRDRWGGAAKIQSAYRRAIRDDHLAMTFNEPRKIKTDGGEITAIEIVLDTTGTQTLELFTTDDENRVIVHAKYSGETLLKFLGLVKEIAAADGQHRRIAGKW
jgi:hypothetical protein